MTGISAEQFERDYAGRSSMTVDQLRQTQTVRACECGHESCEGWAMVSISQASRWDADAPRFGQVAGSVIEGRP